MNIMNVQNKISIGDVNDSKDDGNVDTCDEDSEV